MVDLKSALRKQSSRRNELMSPVRQFKKNGYPSAAVSPNASLAQVRSQDKFQIGYGEAYPGYNSRINKNLTETNANVKVGRNHNLNKSRVMSPANKDMGHVYSSRTKNVKDDLNSDIMDCLTKNQDLMKNVGHLSMDNSMMNQQLSDSHR